MQITAEELNALIANARAEEAAKSAKVEEILATVRESRENMWDERDSLNETLNALTERFNDVTDQKNMLESTLGDVRSQLDVVRRQNECLVKNSERVANDLFQLRLRIWSADFCDATGTALYEVQGDAMLCVKRYPSAAVNIAAMIIGSNKIEMIKFFRTLCDMDLRTAKDFVELNS